MLEVKNLDHASDARGKHLTHASDGGVVALSSDVDFLKSSCRHK